MKKFATAPITIFTPDAQSARELASASKSAEAIVSGPGTLNFHKLIAAHGAGDFETLFCPVEYKDKWRTPCGGKVYFATA